MSPPRLMLAEFRPTATPVLRRTPCTVNATRHYRRTPRLGSAAATAGPSTYKGTNSVDLVFVQCLKD